jgi:hypothetical protein
MEVFYLFDLEKSHLIMCYIRNVRLSKRTNGPPTSGLSSLRRKVVSTHTRVSRKMDGGAIFAGMNRPLSGEFFSNHICFLQECWLSPASMLFSREYLNTSHTCGSVSDFGHLAANYSLFLICRNPETHFPIYKRRCEEQGVLMHECAIPVSSKESGGGYVFIHSHLITTDFFICRQKTLDENLAP